MQTDSRNPLPVDEFTSAIEVRSARGIAAGIGRLIRSGTLQIGDRLPTVRTIAADLGVSPATVSEAWQSLAQAGVIESRGRAGTFVRTDTETHGPARYRRITHGPGAYERDYSTGIPDTELLPDLSRATRHAELGDLTTNYFDDPVDPLLHEALAERWPFTPQAVTVVDGCLDALVRVANEVVRFGDRVLIENPTFPPVLDMLGDLGADVIAVECDAFGPSPASLADGLAMGPVAFFYQPRGTNPTGVSVSAERADELAALLAEHPEVAIIENDHAAAICTAPPQSMGTRFPDRTTYVMGFSKSHGPDLRLAAVAGPADTVDAVATQRRLGPGWSSRIMQRLLAAMLNDPATAAVVDTARSTYALRRNMLFAALADRGITPSGTDGIYAWIPVLDEASALISLASRGIGASPGSPFEAKRLEQPHLRVTVGLVADGVDELADMIAAAAAIPPSSPHGRTL